MKIILASPRGFCAGVNMAIESLDLAITAFGSPIYVYHEIVHNKYVVDTFRGKGVVFVDELEEVPTGATLLFSAHGVSPDVRRVARESSSTHATTLTSGSGAVMFWTLKPRQACSAPDSRPTSGVPRSSPAVSCP